MVYVGSPMYQDFSYISHHGILGMKWGVRRYQNKDGTLTAAGKRRLANIEKKSAKYEKKKKELLGDNANEKTEKKDISPRKTMREMSNEDLRKAIERLDLETRYSRALRESYNERANSQATKKHLIDGRKIVGDILTSSLTNVGKNVGENVLGANVNKFGRRFGIRYDLYTKQQQQSQSTSTTASSSGTGSKKKKKRP